MAGMLAILVGVVLLGGAGLLYAAYRQE